MSVQVQLPPGCEGLTMQDGTRYSSRPGGAVTVSDEHAAAVHRYSGGDAAILHGHFRAFASSRKRDGRWCGACRRLWHAWSLQCPRCQQPTQPEAEAAS